MMMSIFKDTLPVKWTKVQNFTWLNDTVYGFRFIFLMLRSSHGFIPIWDESIAGLPYDLACLSCR